MKYLLGAFLILLVYVLPVNGQQPHRKILFTAFDSDEYIYHFFLADDNGDNVTFLFDSFGSYYRVSPDGAYILYKRLREGSIAEGHYDIVVRSLEDGFEFRLTDGRDNFSPIWSPNGEQIAFVSGEETILDLYIADFNSMADEEVFSITRLTHLKEDVGGLDWLADGKQIAFSACVSPDICDIYIVDIETGALKNLSSAFDYSISAPTWSPDGQQIAFYAFNEDLTIQMIQVLDLQTMNVNMLTQADSVGSFEWAPDGSKIAFASTENDGWDIYVADADGNNRSNLTNNQQQIVEDAGYGLDWSSDGSQIVYSAGPFDGYFQIFIMNADGSNVRRLTQMDYHLISPSWVYGY
jgi:TolB protein